MIASRLKVVMFAALALILSAGHAVCADVSSFLPEAAPAQLSAGAHQSHHGHEQSAESGHHGAHGDPASKPANEHAPKNSPCGPSQSGCSHCETAQFFKTSPVNFVAALGPPMPTFAAALSEIVVTSERILSRASHAARRQHGPPDDTPVSLKVKLAN